MAQVDKKEAYNTGCSQAVTHPSTDPARRCLTSVIGREPVHSAWYGRRRQTVFHSPFYRYWKWNSYATTLEQMHHLHEPTPREKLTDLQECILKLERRWSIAKEKERLVH